MASIQRNLSHPDLEHGVRQRRDVGRIVLRNTIAVTAGGWTLKLLNFAFMIYIVRILGEVGLGHYATVVAFVGLVGVFFELGTAQYVQRELARGSAHASSLFWNLLTLRFCLAFAGAALTTLLSLAMGYESTLVLGVLLFTLTYPLAAILVACMTLLTANERFDIATAAQILGQLVTMAVAIVLLWQGMGFLALVVNGFIALPVQIAFCVRTIQRSHLSPGQFQPSPRDWPALIRASLPFGVTSLALTFNYNVDTVILGLFRGASEVGWYHAVYRLVFSMTGITSGFSHVMMPTLAREHMSDSGRVRGWTQSAILALLMVALPVSVGGSILASEIVQTLFDVSFAPSASVLALIIWNTPLMMTCAFCGNVLAAIGLEKKSSRIYVLSASLNLLLNLLLIPRYGMMAAAAVTIATDSVTTILFLRLLRQHMQLVLPVSKLVGITLAALTMGAVVWVISPHVLPVAIVIGAIIYGAMLLVFRVLNVSDLSRSVRGLLSKA